MFAPRCPWCGAIIPINFKRRELHFMTDFCSKCGHEIKLKKDSRQFWLNALCNASLVALPAIKYENTVSSHIGIRTIRSFDHPYVKVSKHYVPEKRAKYKIVWDQKNVKHPNFWIIEDTVIILCFVDKNDIAISPMIAAALYTIEKVDKCTSKGILSFVKYGLLDKDYAAGTNFLVYCENKVVSRGVLEDDIHYPSF